MNEYKKLILSFLKNGYEPQFFMESPPEKNALILRHDIDFDVEYAYRLSQVEDEIGVKSTYFFMIHSKSYNLLESKNIDYLMSIKSRGHQISIHFDPTIHQDIESGFQREKQLFESFFDVHVEFVSIHRPSEYFLNNPKKICGVYHTYQPNYFEKIKYFADSQGIFRYGHPLESDEFASGDTIQLLIHPVWWVNGGVDSIGKLEEFLKYRIIKFQNHMSNNCKPYKEYIERES